MEVKEQKANYSSVEGVKHVEGAPIVQVRLVPQVNHYHLPVTQFRSPEDVAQFLIEYFADKAVEVFMILTLNTANRLINVVECSTGSLAAAIVEPRTVFQAALLSNASSIIAAHNHPSGNPEPSREDIRVTRQLVEAGKIVGISVHDHLIIADKRYTSLAERGLMG